MAVWSQKPKPGKRFGWCAHHNLWLTVRQVRNKELRCLQCRHFKKNKEHHIWRRGHNLELTAAIGKK